MMADKQFTHGTYLSIKSRVSKPNAADTYLLRFAFDSNVMNFMRYLFAGRKVRGTCHADDCNFIFKNGITPHLPTHSPEFKTIDRFVIIFFLNRLAVSNLFLFRSISGRNSLALATQIVQNLVNLPNGIPFRTMRTQLR